MIRFIIQFFQLNNLMSDRFHKMILTANFPFLLLSQIKNVYMSMWNIGTLSLLIFSMVFNCAWSDILFRQTIEKLMILIQLFSVNWTDNFQDTNIFKTIILRILYCINFIVAELNNSNFYLKKWKFKFISVTQQEKRQTFLKYFHCPFSSCVANIHFDSQFSSKIKFLLPRILVETDNNFIHIIIYCGSTEKFELLTKWFFKN